MASFLEKKETSDRFIIVWAGYTWQIRDTWTADRYSGEETLLAATRHRLEDAAELASEWNATEERNIRR